MIGEGGLGIVVAARHIHLDQMVAIKYLRPKSLASKIVADRFLREARLAAKIRSEHVVHVYDVGTLPDGAPYMVMEYLAGTDLGRQLSASGPLPVDRAVDYVLQACEGLAEAHVAGIVHRDIKPDNLFIATSAGGKSILKLLDFGISKLSSKRSESGRLQELTEAGDKFGTPVYMSPEQLLASRDVDARTDVWSMGVVFFELLTGRLPFDGDSLPELCAAILTKSPVALLEARPYLPEHLEKIIGQCLAKDVDQRFQNVAELAQELRAYAAPAWTERINNVVQLIQGSGDKVRPSTPGPPMTRSQHEAPTMAVSEALPEERSLPTTGSGIGAWAPATGTMQGLPPKRSLVRIGASVGAAVVALSMVIYAATSSRSEKGAAGQAQSVRTAEAPQSTPPVTAPDTPVQALAPPPQVAPSSPSEASASTQGSPEAAAAPGSASASRHGARHAPHAAPSTSAAPMHADPNAVINPFE
jgi:serine/threonine-protein kinase